MIFDLVIVGGGPAGLSTAARAADLGQSHLMLESGSAHANTIQRYQKGKHVMAEPTLVPLRSDLGFVAGTREAVLESWQQGIDKLNVNVRYGCEVESIEGAEPQFRLTLAGGEIIEAKAVVLAIGLQGNPRKLGVSGEDDSFVQYTLDDPDEYHGETIVIVGAGDAAIENAVALARNNTVIIVNRRDEFARAKEGNLTLITRAIDDGAITCAEAFRGRVEAVEDARLFGRVAVNLHRLPGQVAADQRSRGPFADHPPLAHDGDPVAKAFGFVHVVGGEQHRGSPRAQLADARPEPQTHRRVEARRGLVENQELGAVHQRLRDGEPPLEAAREGGHRQPGVGAQLEEVDQLFDALGPLRLPDQVIAREDAQVFGGGQLRDEDVFLKRDPEPGPHCPGFFGDVHAEDQDPPFARIRGAVDHANRGGLAGAVGAQQSEAAPP